MSDSDHSFVDYDQIMIDIDRDLMLRISGSGQIICPVDPLEITA